MVMDNKGQITALLVWMALAFITVLFFAVWVYGFNIVTNKISGIDTAIGSNETVGSIGTSTFGKINSQQTTGLHILAFVMIFMSAISILISHFIIKSHPVFFVVYLFVIIGAVMGATLISNVYEGLMDSGVLATTLEGFSGASFIMLNLPLWVITIGIFGSIFLFAGILRDSGAGGSVV